jgi:2-amino-4-hydroxy-6-hydroxymethyldihydropteridine diphosphokinase
MSQIYLSLGANLGDRATSLRQALAGLERDVTVTAVSPLYETEPWGVINQPPFLNLCVGGQTSLPPGELLHFCQTVEQEVGRTPTYRWGPRLIDIDLLFYNDMVISSEPLIIPHPGLATRAFVLAPLADIAPDFVHPESGLTVAQMLANVSTTAVTRLSNQPFVMEIGD